MAGAKRAILGTLKRKALLAIADAEGVELPERRALDPIRQALGDASGLSVDDLITHLDRSALKKAAKAVGVDARGDEAALRERLAGSAGASSGSQGSLFGESAASSQEPAKATKADKPRKPRKKPKKAAKGSGDASVSLDFADKLWAAADSLRGHMDPSEYKHVMLGLLFLKYVSDAFEERRAEIERLCEDPESDYFLDEDERVAELPEILEDRDEYAMENVFWVPKDARWTKIRAEAKQPTIGKMLDAAMDAIGAENPKLKNVLPRVFALPGLDKHKLGKLIDLVSGIGLGTKEHRAKDTLGRVYEYFLTKFAGREGKAGGEHLTPPSVVRLLVAMLEPYSGRVYDPCCGTGGMFVQSIKFIQSHNGKRDQVSIYGQESNPTTWKLANMNLAIRGISANLGGRHGDTFHNDLHPDLRADFVIANPPFNDSDWGGERLRDDVRWKYGVPPTGNANFAWVQHFVHHLAPDGVAGFVLANGYMSSMQSGEGEIRKALVEADLVDCIVALPGQLFFGTGIPACLWFLAKNRAGDKLRDRRGEILFIDARNLGRLETRVHRVLDDDEVDRIALTYRRWRKGVDYEDEPGFCKSASTEVVRSHQSVLTPGRFVGAAELDDEAGLPFDEKMQALTDSLRVQIEKGQRLDVLIEKNLQSLGF